MIHPPGSEGIGATRLAFADQRRPSHLHSPRHPDPPEPPAGKERQSEGLSSPSDPPSAGSIETLSYKIPEPERVQILCLPPSKIMPSRFTGMTAPSISWRKSPRFQPAPLMAQPKERPLGTSKPLLP